MSQRSNLRVRNIAVGSGGRAARLFGTEARLVLPAARCEFAYELQSHAASGNLNIFQRRVRQNYRGQQTRASVIGLARLDLAAMLPDVRNVRHGRQLTDTLVNLWDGAALALRGKLGIRGQLVDLTTPRIMLRGGVAAAADLLPVKGEVQADMMESHGEVVFAASKLQPDSSLAIGLRNRRAVTPNYQSRNVSIAGLNIPLNDLPGIARSTTELYGRLSTPDTRIELAFDVDKSRLAVSLGFDV